MKGTGQKLQSSNMVHIWRISNCIVGLRLRFIALVCLFSPFYFLSLFVCFHWKLVIVFLENIQFGILLNGYLFFFFLFFFCRIAKEDYLSSFLSLNNYSAEKFRHCFLCNLLIFFLHGSVLLKQYSWSVVRSSNSFSWST